MGGAGKFEFFYRVVVGINSLIDLLFVIEILFSNEFLRSERRLVIHQIVVRVLQDSLLSVVRSLKSLEGGSERAISTRRLSRGEDRGVHRWVKRDCFLASPVPIEHTLALKIPHPCLPVFCLLRPMLW